VKYLVIGLVDAQVSDCVEADSVDEAIDKADLHASVCHQCSDTIEVGDIQSVRVVADGGGGEVLYDEDANDDAARAAGKTALSLLRRIEKYCREDKATTKRATRLERALDEARALLAEVDGKDGVK